MPPMAVFSSPSAYAPDVIPHTISTKINAITILSAVFVTRTVPHAFSVIPPSPNSLTAHAIIVQLQPAVLSNKKSHKSTCMTEKKASVMESPTSA